GTADEPALLARNVAAMESCASALLEEGHFPVLGEWDALPMVRLSGSTKVGDAVYDALFHAHAQRLLERCDAVLRIGGPSDGADAMVSIGERLGLQIYRSLAEVPAFAPA